ncbi:SagB family peptide dehydrogenase [Streptomyces sp. Li-HN-5-11]|uniref:SagB/ThcOx family dehydrogenase n=1 Tax=Streptomyces sp. Li-HN-5-11 TaxID=3075432 RepID=UPI0028B0CE87|nr:SagB family peptide dehydrogenase [Streptomyces sp. Li-HN-5-11]WNM34717.1 SagB family peptide dehydrogenase [Streptomyces sp. Li-HN-5-11]
MRPGNLRPVRDASPPGLHGDDAAAEYLVAFRDDVRAEFEGSSVSLTSPVSTFVVRLPEGGVRDALALLTGDLVPVDKVLDGLVPAERVQFQRLLRRIERLLVRGVRIGGRELIRVEHTTYDAAPGTAVVRPDDVVRLSGFALCRRRSGMLVLESPLAGIRVLLVHRAARELVASLGSVQSAGELAESAGKDLSAAEVRTLLGILAGAGFVELRSPGGEFGEEEDPVLRQWDFHDLLFHSRIRSGRFDEPLGGVFPHRGKIPPRAAVKEPPEGPSVALYRPRLDDIARRDPGLTAVLEGRRSFRGYGEQPLTAEQMGEFLYRVGRVRAHFVPAAGDEPGGEMVSRPYPTGGSAFELELYLTVQRCAGIDQGIYYYDPVGHRLVLVNDDPRDRRAMLEVASVSTNREADPDILITMTSRFQRLSWKYSGMAYATTLRHTGVLYQTMYLVATAMGMAPCGLGIGNADMSARVLGLDYLQESSVGDFILGSRPPGDPGIWDREQGWTWVNDPEWGAWAGSVLRGS